MINLRLVNAMDLLQLILCCIMAYFTKTINRNFTVVSERNMTFSASILQTMHASILKYVNMLVYSFS